MTPSGRRWIVRAPNHLGDVVMALPAMAAAGADVLVVRWLAPVLEMAGLPGAVLPFDRGLGGWRRAVATLRSRGYHRGTLLTPAFSAAWLMRWGGVRRLRGTATDGRSLLLHERVPPEALRGHHRINQYRLLLEQDADGEPLVSRIAVPPEVARGWRERLPAPGPIVGLFPGSNAPARRWPRERFVEVARRLAAEGAGVVVMGGARETELTRAVARDAPPATDLGGATDLPDLAAVLSLCRLAITNDTGPMHLASAVGTPTVTVWGPSDPAEVRPTGPGHVGIGGPTLPCKPCFKNECPRSGAGTLTSVAHGECMRLITTESVVEAALSHLKGGAS